MAPVLAAARDRHGARLRINAVFDQLGDRLQWAGLRQGDDGDGVPVVADLQLAACPARVFCLSVHATARCLACFLLSWRGPARSDRSIAGPEFRSHSGKSSLNANSLCRLVLAKPTGIITISQIHHSRTDLRPVAHRWVLSCRTPSCWSVSLPPTRRVAPPYRKK